MGRFASVTASSESRTPRGKENAQLSSLYEARDIFSIGDENTENTDPGILDACPAVHIGCNGSWLAVGIESDLSVFSLMVDCTHEYNYSLNEKICGVALLGGSDLLSVFTADRHFYVLSSKFGLLMNVLLHNDGKDSCRSANISATVIGDKCFVCIVDDNGITDIITFSYWNNLANYNDTQHSKDLLQKIVNTATFDFKPSKYIVSDMFVSKTASAIVATTAASEAIKLAYFGSFHGEDEVDPVFSGQSKLSGSLVRIREICYGRYLVGVTSTGQLILYDMWTFFHITHKKPIDLHIEKGAEVLDFIFIESPREEFTFETIVLIVKKGNSHFLQIVNISNGEVSYTLDVEAGTKFVASCEAAQRVMILAEPSNYGVTLKELTETEPEKKLTRLIDQNRLDEAEKFAIEFGLDCQRVYISRMDSYFEASHADSSDEIFAMFMKSMDKVADANRVGETCYSGAAIFTNYGRVQALLQYAEKREITDKDCMKKLNELAYIFATYRMVVKPENASFEHWALFVEGTEGPGQWLDIFYAFLLSGQISEARIIYNRHTKYIQEAVMIDLAVPSELGELPIFEKLKTILNNNIAIWRNVVDLLEYDILPHLFLSSDDYQVFHPVVDFMLYMAKRLEKFEAANFPSNALYVTSILERICHSLSNESVTPTKQALLALEGRKYYTEESRTQELTIYSENLKEIKRLKEVYHCSLSYDKFTELDAERICYHILRTAVENPNMVATRVAKFARPYMDEHRLDPDRTIFRYIEDVSKNALFVLSGANPWHEQCLLVSETIENYSLKCQAITIIAKSMQPPWPKNLSGAVTLILNSNMTEDLAIQLQHVCDRAELGQILQTYNVNFTLLDTILSNDRQFSKFLMYVVQQDASHEAITRDALKAVDLYEKLCHNSSVQVNKVFVYVSIALNLLRKTGHRSMISYVEGLQAVDDIIRPATIEALVERLVLEVNSTTEFSDKDVCENRLKMIYAIESIIQRFCSSDASMESIYYDIIAVRKLQENYKKWVTISNLHDEEWKKQQFVDYIVTSQRELPQLFAFAEAIHLKPDMARVIALELARKEGVMTVAHILKEAVLTVLKPSKLLVEKYIEFCQFIFSSLEQYSDPQDADSVLDVIYMMPQILSGIVQHCLEEHKLLDKALRMEHYIRLAILTIEQFILDDSPATPVEKESMNIEKATKDERVCGFSRRLGVHLIADDGAIMNRDDMLSNLCKAAFSVVQEYGDLTEPEDIVGMQTRWDDLCGCLSLDHQDVLVYAFRVFSAYLPCFYGHDLELHKSLRPTVRSLCERTVQMHPCDLWTCCGVLMSIPPKDAERLTVDLRSFVTLRKNPQTLINYLRVVQFVVLHLKKSDYFVSLTAMFIQQLWRKRLAKVHLSAKGLKSKVVHLDLEEFAKKKLDPLMVAEFLSQFYPNQVDDQMLNYAMYLTNRASTETVGKEASVSLQTAELAVKLCNSSRNHIYWRSRHALYTLCPYNYEPLLFIVRLMSECLISNEVISHTDDEHEPEKFVMGCQKLLEFIVTNPRNGQITKAEINWYIQYQKVWQKDLQLYGNKDTDAKRQDCFGTMLMEWFEDGTTNMDSTSGVICGGELKYERNDTLVSSLPPNAQHLLPLHLFLSRSQDDVERWVKPVAEAEVNLTTVGMWRTVARTVPWLKCLPRQVFLLHAVMKKIKECTSKGLPLDRMDKSLIVDLFAQPSSADDVAACLVHCAKNLSLSEPKIQLISAGVEVANGWLEHPGFSGAERENIEDSKKRYEHLIEKYKTELLLKKEGLYNSKTSDLIEMPSDLISHIYSECVDWNSSFDIRSKAELVQNLAIINNMNLKELQEDLIFRWLLEGEPTSDGFVVNLDDTMGSISLPTTVDTPDESDLVKLPIYESAITKIVHLLRQIDYHRLFPRLYQQFVKQDVNKVPGGYKTTIRASCVLLRAYNNEDFRKLNFDPTEICKVIETALSVRLFEVARIDLPFDTYVSQKKLTVVKMIMAPTKRHSPEQCALAATIVIDYDIVDKSLVEQLLTKLCQARKKDIYNALLKYCRETPSLHAVKNIGNMWPRLIETSALYDMPREEAMRSIYFLLSCPVEIKGFDPIRILAGKMPVAATLLYIASNFTKNIPNVGNRNDSSSRANDIDISWFQ